MNKRNNKQNMVNIPTDMWESEISETRELKQILSQCSLKSRFCTKTNSWWSNWCKILITTCHTYFSQKSYHEYLITRSCMTSMLQILYEISTNLSSMLSDLH